MDTKVKDKSNVDKAKAALRGLSEAETREVMAETAAAIPGIVIPNFCPLVVKPTGFETDLATIMERVSITTVITDFQGSAINEDETFTVKATVKNCSQFDLVSPVLRASEVSSIILLSPPASITGSDTAYLGFLGHGQSVSVEFDCVANRTTDGSRPLIDLKLTATPVLSASVSAVVEGEIIED